MNSGGVAFQRSRTDWSWPLTGSGVNREIRMGRVREAIGLMLLSVGIVGCVLPVIPGLPFLLGAIAVLGPSHPKVKPWIKRIQQWFSLARKHGT